MDIYLAFVAIIIVLSLLIACPIARYLTGYSWPATILLILLSSIIYSLIGPLVTLPYFNDVNLAPTSENYLKLYAISVFIKTVIDTFLLQLVSTVFVSTNTTPPPFLTTFKLLFIANIAIMAVIAWLYIYNVVPELIKAVGITAA
jgi:hypothetical protein